MKLNEMQDDSGQESRTAVLVMSCKRFKQVWHPFFVLFHKFWPHCPYEVFLATDSDSYPGVKMLSTGEPDPGWGTICLNALRNINAERIIMFQEDFLIRNAVDNYRVRKLVRHAFDYNIGCLRLGPCPGPTAPWHATEALGLIGKTDEYRVSLQLAIWKKSVLMSLVRDGDSPWLVEVRGPERVKDISEPFVSVWREFEGTADMPVPYIITAVVRGVWQSGALQLLKHEGIPMDGITKRII